MTVVEVEEGVVLEQLDPVRRKIYDLYEKFASGEIKWIKGVLADQSGGYCIMGGLRFVEHLRSSRDITQASSYILDSAEELYPRVRGGYDGVESFNDSRCSKTPILAVLKHAALSGLGKEDVAK